MQGTLFMSALHLYALQGAGANPIALLHYKGQAVQEVNRRLSFQRDAFDDRTLWAVACLTLGEVRSHTVSKVGVDIFTNLSKRLKQPRLRIA
jgi:Fungal specific transcription factor domain